VQYAKKMGFRTVAIGFGPDKEHLAPKLGAHVYIDAKAEDAGAALQKLGGADVILATAPSGAAIASLISRPLSSRKARGRWCSSDRFPSTEFRSSLVAAQSLEA